MYQKLAFCRFWLLREFQNFCEPLLEMLQHYSHKNLVGEKCLGWFCKTTPNRG